MKTKGARWQLWVLLALVSVASVTFIVLAWVLPEPPPPAPSEDVTARSHRSAPRAAAAATCVTDAGAEPVQGAIGHTPDGRTFHVWGPAAPSRPLPVVLLLHGYQSNGSGFQWWFHFDRQTKDEAYAVYPDGTSPSWDFTGETDLDYLERVLDEMSRTYCVDRSRVLVFGFSYGARMASHVACKRPDLVKAMVAGGGDWVDADPECGGSLPVLLLHRTRDPAMPIKWGHDAVKRWARTQGCSKKESASKLGEGCTEFLDCRVPGSVGWCEDSWFDPQWPESWNHTVREPHKELAWRWFMTLP